MLARAFLSVGFFAVVLGGELMWGQEGGGGGTAAVTGAADSPEAEAAWKKVEAQSPSLNPPAEWRQRQPEEAEVKRWMGPEAERLLGVASAAEAFVKQFPQSRRVPEAWVHATEALYTAGRLGAPQAKARLAAIDQQRLAQPGLTEEERFEIRMREVESRAAELLGAMEPGAEAPDPKAEKAAREYYIQSARALCEEFPKRPEPFAMLLEVAGDGEDAESRTLVNEVANSNAPESVRERAREIQKKVALLGQTLDLKFTAIDGREVDLAKLRGKIVLIDFWATWCGNCVSALPSLKSSYEELHKLDFEIIGISFDEDRQKLESFVKSRAIAWPQYYDGKGWKNAFGQKYGITALPAMWLVDQQGVLRDLHGEHNLDGKVQALLQEKAKPAAK